MADNDSRRAILTGPGIRAVLSSIHDDRCLLEVWTDCQNHGQAEQVQIDVLLQPREQRGLPHGPPVLLHQASIPLLSCPDGRHLVGRCRLPRSIQPRIAHNCHYRVRTSKLSEVIPDCQ